MLSLGNIKDEVLVNSSEIKDLKRHLYVQVKNF